MKTTDNCYLGGTSFVCNARALSLSPLVVIYGSKFAYMNKTETKRQYNLNNTSKKKTINMQPIQRSGPKTNRLYCVAMAFRTHSFRSRRVLRTPQYHMNDEHSDDRQDAPRIMTSLICARRYQRRTIEHSGATFEENRPCRAV